MAYGKINTHYVPIILKNEKDISINKVSGTKLLKTLKTNSDSDYKVVDFVAAAFDDMQKEFKKASKEKKLNPNATFSFIEATSAYKDPRVLYGKLLKLHHDKFINYLAGNKYHDKILDFKTFLNYYFQYIDLSLTRRPLTLSGFVKSRHCTPSISGLSISLSNLIASNDYLKANSYINGDNFCFFASAAKSYGFYIDRNQPWRLIADINSPAMSKYISQFLKVPATGQTHPEHIFRRYYTPAHYEGFERFINLAISSYNSYVAIMPIVGTVRRCVRSGRPSTGAIRRVPIKHTQALSMFGMDYWIEKYIDVRNKEEKNYLSPELLNIFKVDIKNLLQFDPPSVILDMPVSANYRTKLHPLLDMIEAKFANLHKHNGSISDYAGKRRQRRDVLERRDATGESVVASTPSTGGGNGSTGGGGY